MTRAEQAALKAYPRRDVKGWHSAFGTFEFDGDYDKREGYKEGYEQAEKDIISIIESRISEILGDAQPSPTLRAELRELINKIEEQ